MFMDLGDGGAVETPADVPLSALLPAFITSELKTAFKSVFAVLAIFGHRHGCSLGFDVTCR